MAIFIDAFYPDNKERAKRVAVLASECQAYCQKACEHKILIEETLKSCNDVVKKTYEKLEKKVPEIKKVDIEEGYAVYVTELLLDVFAITATVSAMRWGIANYYVSIGKIEAKELSELGANAVLKVVMPKWLKVGAEVGAAIVIQVMVDMIVDAIDGQIERTKLREAIEDVAITRVQCKLIEMHNENVLTTIRAAETACRAIENLPLDKETIDEIMKNIVTQHNVATAETTLEAAITCVKAADEAIHSWTKEDGNWEDKVRNAVNQDNILQETMGEAKPFTVHSCLKNAITKVEDVTDDVREMFLDNVAKLQ